MHVTPLAFLSLPPTHVSDVSLSNTPAGSDVSLLPYKERVLRDRRGNQSAPVPVPYTILVLSCTPFTLYRSSLDIPPPTQVSTPPPPALLLHTPTYPSLITIPSLPSTPTPSTYSIHRYHPSHAPCLARHMHAPRLHTSIAVYTPTIPHPPPSILSPHSRIHDPTLQHPIPLLSLSSPASYHALQPSHPHQPHIHTYIPPMSCPHISLPDITALSPACRVKQ